ncbi:MAG: DNA-processing protein DprA [Gammaproteobacteria bacterium]|jgi:DNA processing protein
MPDNLTDEPAAWCALWRTPGIGLTHFSRLLERFGAPDAALEADEGQLTAAGLNQSAARAVSTQPLDSAAPDLAWLDASPHHHLLTWASPDYPSLLRELPDPPPLLFVNGDPGLLDYPQLAMVGSRHPTPVGRDTARDFARHLAAAGLCMTSGLAQGIDTACHEGALDAGGLTLAVAGTGLDRIYPAANRALAHRIVEQGAIISEFPIGTGPRPENFPRRNRIISGLSLGTLVVEAARKSGSLITARYALEQGREVFAIPGSIHNPLARGCHRLIREGAKLVETADDILEELGGLLQGRLSSIQAPASGPHHDAPSAAAPLDREYIDLIEIMGFDPVGIDELVARSGLTPEAVSSMLLILELNGHIASVDGGRYLRLKPESMK